jgi:fatty-acyl-CoA synthase
MFERGITPALIDAERAWLKTLALPPQAVVAWLGWNRWQMLALLAACEEAGCVLLPLNGRLSEAELHGLLRHSQACALRHDETFAEVAGRLRGSLMGPPQPAEGLAPEDLLLVYTSGTTGQPKGAVHTRTAMLANVQAAIAAQGLHAGTRTLAVLPLFHMGGLAIQVLPTLHAGGQVCLHERFVPEAWFDAVQAWRPSTCLLVPAVMRALVQHPRWPTAALSPLAFVTAGSQILPLALIDAFHAKAVPVAQVYGATETGPVSLVVPPQRALELRGASGVPALAVQARLSPAGELLLRAPNLLRRYHRRAEPVLDKQGYFATGDLALERTDGAYQVVGRCRDLIISGGENIHPAEIEELVSAWPGVADCAVVGLPDERWGEVPVLALVLNAETVFDESGLHAALAARLARFKLPRRVVVLPELPRTALGKVQREVLARALHPASGASGTTDLP